MQKDWLKRNPDKKKEWNKKNVEKYKDKHGETYNNKWQRENREYPARALRAELILLAVNLTGCSWVESIIRNLAQ